MSGGRLLGGYSVPCVDPRYHSLGSTGLEDAPLVICRQTPVLSTIA